MQNLKIQKKVIFSLNYESMKEISNAEMEQGIMWGSKSLHPKIHNVMVKVFSYIGQCKK